MNGAHFKPTRISAEQEIHTFRGESAFAISQTLEPTLRWSLLTLTLILLAGCNKKPASTEPPEPTPVPAKGPTAPTLSEASTKELTDELMKRLDSEKVKRAKSDMRAVEQSVQKYYMEQGGAAWPKSTDSKDRAAVAENLTNKDEKLLSPWGTPYTWTIYKNKDGYERPRITCKTPEGEMRHPE